MGEMTGMVKNSGRSSCCVIALLLNSPDTSFCRLQRRLEIKSRSAHELDRTRAILQPSFELFGKIPDARHKTSCLAGEMAVSVAPAAFCSLAALPSQLHRVPPS
jgi:hypothetical protein